MLIRSQDKRSTTTDLNLEIFVNEDRNEYVIGNITRGGLGTYSTEEKAIKVLDMICEKYKCPDFQNRIGENEVAIYKHIVFQMPQDEKVKV